MSARPFGWAVVALLAAACRQPTSGVDAGNESDAGARDDAGSVPRELRLWTPGGESGPPGAWIDSVVSASGDLGAGAWALTVEGLPPSVSARFEPPELTASHGAVLRLDVAPTAPMASAQVKVVATHDSERLEAVLPVLVLERTDLPPDFVVQVRAPLTIGPTGAVEVALAGASVDFPAQALSVGGFSGTLQLLVQDANGTMSVSPGVVTVAPGVPAAATVTARVTDEPPGNLAAVHRRAWHGPSGLTFGTTSLSPTPGVNVLPVSRAWLRPGESAAGTLSVRSWGLGSPGFSATFTGAAGVTGSVGAFTSAAATVTFTAASLAQAGPRDVSFSVSASGQQALRSARVVVLGPTPALASAELLAPSLQRDAGTPTIARELDVLVDGAGLEVGRVEQGWWRARESNGFAPELISPQRPAAQIAGVLGGRATAVGLPNTVGITETRSDVGTRPWSVPGGVGSRAALAYDTSKRLWAAVTVDPGVLHLWRMDALSSPTAVPVEFSTGLPTMAISGGPWLAVGATVPTVAFVKGGATHVMQLSGTMWAEFPDVGLSAGQVALDAALATDDLGRPVFAWVEDAAVHVKRFESGAWAELGVVPLTAGAVPRELSLVIDRGAPILVWSEASYEPPPAARLDGFTSHVWFSRFESGAWRNAADLQLDPGADARSLAATLGPDGKLVIGWTEDRVVVVVRGLP